MRSSILSAAGCFARDTGTKFVRCLYLHTVLDDERDGFADLLRLVRNRGETITTQHLLAIITGDAPVDGRYFHLSFDDGFANVVRNGIHLMIEHGVTASLFVATSFVEADDRIVDHYCRHIMSYSAAMPVSTWAMLRDAHAAGFEIGSHTCHHARLSDISHDTEKLRSELEESRKEIERRIGAPCLSFAWPYGTERDADDVSIAAVRQAGYTACFSAVRGRVTPGITDPFRIPRHQVEAAFPRLHKRAWIAGFREAGA